MSVEYGLVFTFFLAQFDIPYLILFVQVTLSHLSKFEIIVSTGHFLVFADSFFFCAKKNKKN